MKLHQRYLFEGYPTYNDLLKALSPDKLLVVFSEIEYIEHSIAKKRVSLEDLNELYAGNGRNPGVDYLTDWIAYLTKYINVKPLIESRAAAFMIYNSYKGLYLADLKLLLEKIAKAEYGRDSLFFGCIDVQRLCYCFAMYNQERSRIANKFYQKLSDQFSKIKEQVENAEKERIFNEVKVDHKDGALWDVYQKRCNEEIPPIVQAKYEEFINNQSNESPKE